jgi:hypothetical protein
MRVHVIRRTIMSAPLLPSGIRPGDGLGDFIAFTTDGGFRSTGPAQSYDDENEGYYRQQRSWDEIGPTRTEGMRPVRESRERGH